MGAWITELKVDFLHGQAKHFKLSRQMFLYMILAAISWGGARIGPNFYPEKLDGMLGQCHPLVKEVVPLICTPFPFALGVSPKGGWA